MPIEGSKDLMEAMRTLDEVAERYKILWTYYAGDLPEHFTAERIARLIASTGAQYRIRLSKKPVDALADRIGIAAITSSKGDSVNLRIEEIRQANDMELYEPFLHTRVLAMGDSYLFVYPVSEEEDLVQRDGERVDAVPDEDTRDVGVELAYQSPVSCRAFYDSEDGRRVRFVCRRWKENGPIGAVWRAEVWYSDRLESWVTQPGAKGTDPVEWQPYAEDAQGNQTAATDWPAYHDFGEIPIKHARNDLPYGRSELADFIGVQNAITKTFATQTTGIESNGWRERWRIADDASIMEGARDAVNWDDGADATKANRPTVSGRRTGFGMEHTYFGTKAVGEYSPTDLGNFIDPVEQWIRLGSIATDTPLYEFDPRTGAQMSGIARKRADMPMKNKEKRAKRFLTRFWREVYGFALALDGVEGGELTISWEPPAVEDDPEWWAVADIRRQHGVPQRQILTEANYTPEELDEWAEDEDEALLLDGKIQRLKNLGEALQAVGAGATLLRLNDDRVAQLVNGILGDVGSPGSVTDLIEEPEPVVEPNPEEDEDAEEDEGVPPSGQR